ncbi:hypothetical protein PUV54_12780 [Hyphococcus flavus]|uniref:Cytochrome c domain-containing protein n=1 Tax=Hyphococcus flavus TaxID=1866326 RepID=A0AAE9ZAQ8_9PROT|nr:hypothetical protein [Hyphococcus flavus]WDI30829.1 hypothetical protein PUV54_12780 [Hyphococcus flavus]
MVLTEASAKQLTSSPILTELSWIASDSDGVEFFTREPAECFKRPKNQDDAYLAEVGRAAFRSPFLLGGQAARQGLSCQSCHMNGHDNPSFFIAGLSGAPGTADVTSSVFSKTREDHEFNPVPIPDLTGIADKQSFGTQAPAPSMHAFVSGAVTDEFQGAPPTETVLKGLVVYLVHLDPAACPSSDVTRTVQTDMAEVERNIAAAVQALERGDAAAGDFLIVSAQAALGRIHERFAAPSFEPQRERLQSASSTLGDARANAREEPVLGAIMLKNFAQDLPGIAQDLHAHRRASLYDVGVLRAALEAAEE